MLTIGQLAAATDTTADTLRYYEREGLICPDARSESRYRLYERDAMVRLRFIKHAQACGFTLTEIRELLALRTRSDACCGEVRVQALDKQRQLQAKIRTLKAMSAALGQLIADCAQPEEAIVACPIMAAFDRALTAVPNSAASLVPDESATDLHPPCPVRDQHGSSPLGDPDA